MAVVTEVANWIKTHSESTPNKVAIHYHRDGQPFDLSYQDLEAQIAEMVDFLSESLALQTGQRIAWYGMNNPKMLVLLFAAARCGLILVPLNWRLALPEVKFIIDDCGPSAVFYDQHFADNTDTVLVDQASCHRFNIDEPSASPSNPSNGGLSDNTSLGDSQLNSADNISSPNQATDIVDDTPLMIVYTSGTTGHPKGAVLSHASFACNARMSQHMHNMTADDHILSFLPIFHVGGFNIQMLPALSLGATVTLLEKFDPREAVNVLNTAEITHVVCVPTILQALLAQPNWSPEKLSLKALSIGSTDVPLALIETIHSYDIPLLQVYGTTETSPLAIYQRATNAFETVGSIGHCGSDCEIRLVDDAGDDVEPGENGEIWVKGKNTLSSYWNNTAATEANIVDGWFRSGDVAHCDEHGFYWFADRLKHVIISGGENIYAAELERVIRNLPGLSELVIVGKPDEKWGEVAVVVAVRDPAEIASNEAIASRVLDAFQGQLARFKHPREVIFIESLPRTALGKVQVDAVKSTAFKAD